MNSQINEKPSGQAEHHERARRARASMAVMDCGKVKAVHVDKAAGVAWIETDSHGITIAWPDDDGREAPVVGTEVVMRRGLDVIGIGVDGQRQWYEVVREASIHASLCDSPKRSRQIYAQIVVVTVALALVAIVQTGRTLYGLGHLVGVTPFFEEAGIAAITVGAMLLWRKALRMWTVVPVLGVARKTDQAAEVTPGLS